MAKGDASDYEALLAEVEATLGGQGAKQQSRSAAPAPRQVSGGAPGRAQSAPPAARGASSPVAKGSRRERMAAAWRLALITAIIIGLVVYGVSFTFLGLFGAIPVALGAAMGAVPATIVGRLSR